MNGSFVTLSVQEYKISQNAAIFTITCFSRFTPHHFIVDLTVADFDSVSEVSRDLVAKQETVDNLARFRTFRNIFSTL